MDYPQAERMELFTTGIFMALNQKLTALKAQGRTVYNCSMGTPDFAPQPHIMQALVDAAQVPHEWTYPLEDLPELRQAVCDFYMRRFGVHLQPDETVAVHGTQEGMGHFGLAFCNPGDAVLLPDPGYPAFYAGAVFGGADIHYYPLLAENDFQLRIDQIDEDLLRRLKYIVISYPSNPCGAAGRRETYLQLLEAAKKYGFLIVNDNAYFDLYYDDAETFSILSLPGAKDVSVEFLSLSKTFNIMGARLGLLSGNKSVVQALTKMRSQVDLGMFLPVQRVAIAALTGPLDFVEPQRQVYQARRDALCGGLRSVGWNVPDSQGTMFVWAPIPAGYESSAEFCDDLIEKAGVLVTPGSSFGPHGEGYVRFSLNHPVERLREIVKAIGDSGIIQ